MAADNSSQTTMKLWDYESDNLHQVKQYCLYSMKKWMEWLIKLTLLMLVTDKSYFIRILRTERDLVSWKYYMLTMVLKLIMEHTVLQLVKALSYKPDDSRFDF
jgi:hypothetical protein